MLTIERVKTGRQDSEVGGGVAVLTLNRPDRRNALSPELVEALRDALAESAADPSVNAIVLTGAGTHFCAGGDLGPSAAADEGFLGQHRARGGFARLMAELMGLSVPVIAAVNGDALGGGVGLVGACHMVVLDERACLSTPELRVGLFPMMIYPVLARSLPRKVLSEMILAGRKLTAPEAERLGFANRVAASGAARDVALELARVVASRSRSIVALGLQAMATVDDLPLDPALHHMHSQLSLNILTEDAAEGITAFMTGRPPAWRGR